MDIYTLRSFFLWCTIINTALLLLSFLLCVSAADWAYRMQNKLFPTSRETRNVILCCFFGLYKTFILMFNLVPYIALSIVGCL